MTSDVPSRSVCLFGTEEPVAAPLLLSAGPLSAELEAGNLRAIRWHGMEMIRAVAFVVRDRNWGTYPVAISDLTVEQDASGFRVAYEAVARDEEQAFSYAAAIACGLDGTLSFECRGVARSPFLTNRTGFVVLHPIDGVAGTPVTLERTDGSIAETRFPLEIDPVQPFQGLRAMTHAFAPGATVTCRMEGDTYETEDQRNWTDASYKTYVRPLASPWPYEIAAGETVNQRISLHVGSDDTARDAKDAGRPVITRLALGDAPASPVPSLGVALDPDDRSAAKAALDRIAQAGIAHLLCHHDPRRGHDGRSLERAAAIAAKAGACPWLEFVVPGIEDFEADIAAAGRIARDLGSPFPVVLLSPAADLKSTLPGSTWPPCPPLDAIYRAARRAFPEARIGGGMFSYFTEFNRKRPPLADIDLATFSTSPLVHAGDDRSVMETLEAVPHVALSARAILGAMPFHVGPSSIGMRLNPYGEAPKDNPRNIRQAMNGADPRQRGLFAAAWALGYFAAFAAGGVCALTMGAAAGPQGFVHAPSGDARPFFDEAGSDGRLYPVFHVIRGLSRLAGRPMVSLRFDGAGDIHAIACTIDGGREIWIANCSGIPHVLDWSALGGGDALVARLDAGNFVAATEEPALLDRLETMPTGQPVELDAYAVLRLVQKRRLI